jgi:hypothetical protein
MKDTQRPSREEFTAYWKDYEDDVFGWRQLLPYVFYLGPLALYALTIRWIDPEGRFWLTSLVAAVGYIVLMPYFDASAYRKRFSRFIRCPSCGDWFGEDASGAYHGPNPKFRSVIETGRCSKCGERILSDHEDAA